VWEKSAFTPATATSVVARDPRRAMAMTLRESFQLQSLLLPCKFPASLGLPQCLCGSYAVEEIH
jgi:hypothetical protein